MKIIVLSDNENVCDKARHIFKKRGSHNIIRLTTVDFEFISDLKPSLIISLHCKKIFPPNIVNSFRCVNVHPGYLPYNRGMYPHVWSIVNGYPAGATIHVMTSEIDKGPWLCRTLVKVNDTDTSETLYNRVIDAELTMLDTYLDEIIDDKIEAKPYESEGCYYSKQDYKELCNIDIGTFRRFYNVLRALSHGDYKNAHIGDTYITLKIHENSNTQSSD